MAILLTLSVKLLANLKAFSVKITNNKGAILYVPGAMSVAISTTRFSSLRSYWKAI